MAVGSGMGGYCRGYGWVVRTTVCIVASYHRVVRFACKPCRLWAAIKHSSAPSLFILLPHFSFSHTCSLPRLFLASGTRPPNAFIHESNKVFLRLKGALKPTLLAHYFQLHWEARPVHRAAHYCRSYHYLCVGEDRSMLRDIALVQKHLNL